MIERLSLKTARLICKNKSSKFSVDMYKYAFFIIYSTLIFGAFSLLAGAALKIAAQSALLFIMFFAIRIYAGGYHSSKEINCEIITSSLLLFAMAVIKISEKKDISLPLIIISALFAALIFIFAPIDSYEKQLSDDEFKRFRLISRIILSVIVITAAISYVFGAKSVFVPSVMSIVLEGILLCAGKIKKSYLLKKIKSK